MNDRKECDVGDRRRKDLSQPGDTEPHLKSDQTSSQEAKERVDSERRRESWMAKA